MEHKHRANERRQNMTRDEAKKIMENAVRCVRNPNCERLECRNCYLVMPEHTVLKAYDVAIKALEQQTCEDAVSRQAVLEQINCWIGSGEYVYTSATDYLKRRIQDIPPVNPQPKTGHWIDREVYDADRWKCSECGRTEPYKENYCPNCGSYNGAKMVETQTERRDKE